jgi:hypothetical protein
MMIFNVHIFREMRLVFGGIEADTHEAAAAVARDKATDQADAIDDCDGETIAALVDVAGDEEYEQTRLIDFEPERERKAASKLLAACRMVVARWERGDLAEAARACSAAIAEAEAAGITEPTPGWIDPVRHARTWVRTAREVLAQPGRTDDVDCLLKLALSQLDAALAPAGKAQSPTSGDPAKTPYSVLLLYPDDANDGGTETYYAWVEAADPIAAVAEARRQAVVANDCAEFRPDDFAPLLVIAGHHYGQPISDQ